jgi:hypothetical protein
MELVSLNAVEDLQQAVCFSPAEHRNQDENDRNRDDQICCNNSRHLQ